MLSGVKSSRHLHWHWRRPLTSALNEVSGAICTKPHGGQRTASAEATYDALRSQTASVAGDTEFFSLYEEELGGTRPDRLYEVRPQDRVQRRTMEQIVDHTLFVPTLDVPVPQMENQLVEVCRLLDFLIPEQAIEVPKVSSSRHSRRRRVRFAEQTADRILLLVARACGAERGHSSSAWWPSSSSCIVVFWFGGYGKSRGFRTFPPKKCDVGSAPGVGIGCGLYFIHAGG